MATKMSKVLKVVMFSNLIHIHNHNLYSKRNYFNKFKMNTAFLTIKLAKAKITSAGDFLEQRYEILKEDQNKWSAKRTLNMSVTGISVGIVCHYWYKFLDKSIPGHTIRIVVKKILVDQLIGSPACIITFFGTLALLEGKTNLEFIEELKKKWWKLYFAEWIVWPTAQFVNFYFLPTKYRVLYDNTVSLGYDVYTSYIAHFDKPKEQR